MLVIRLSISRIRCILASHEPTGTTNSITLWTSVWIIISILCRIEMFGGTNKRVLNRTVYATGYERPDVVGESYIKIFGSFKSEF